MLNRDGFVQLLQMLILGWEADPEMLSPEIEVLINKTKAFLRDEFGE